MKCPFGKGIGLNRWMSLDSSGSKHIRISHKKTPTRLAETRIARTSVGSAQAKLTAQVGYSYGCGLGVHRGPLGACVPTYLYGPLESDHRHHHFGDGCDRRRVDSSGIRPASAFLRPERIDGHEGITSVRFIAAELNTRTSPSLWSRSVMFWRKWLDQERQAPIEFTELERPSLVMPAHRRAVNLRTTWTTFDPKGPLAGHCR